MLHEDGASPKLSILNRHTKFIDGPQLLHKLVSNSAKATDIAIDFLEDGSTRRTITYGVLQAWSDVLADEIVQALARMNSTSTIVPVLLPQSPELYIALLAVLKAGKAFCPIGIDTPKERLEFVLKDVSAELIISDAPQKANIPATISLQVLLADRWASQQHCDATFMPQLINPNELAYVLYTSGSTGVPKAVAISHRAATQSLLAHNRYMPPFQRFLQFASPTFDVSVFEIFFTWYRGCTLVGCTRAQLLNDLPGVIRIMEVDATELTPTVVSNLLMRRDSVPGLNLLLTIGEMLSRRVIDEFGGDSSKQSILWGMYGPTEAAIHCTLQPSFPRKGLVGNIGLPLDTVSIFIAAPSPYGSFSDAIKVLPIGEIGELVIGGHQLAAGYLNRPKQTEASFVEDPEYGRLYRTGDKARLHPDGTLECLGRLVSGQVKIRGQRVELGEIEAVIDKLDDCHAIAVMVIDDNLVAFCAATSHNISCSTVTEICRQWLPSYMVPTTVVLLQNMPLLPSGKVDKTALELLYSEHEQRRQCDVRPHIPEDQCALSVLEAVEVSLGRPLPVGADLASLGLDSLRSIRVASMLRKRDFNVGAMDVLSASNIDDLINLCRSKKGLRTGTDFGLPQDLMLQIRMQLEAEGDVLDIIPCTPLQEAMLAETVARPSAYCNWVEVELVGSLTISSIRRCLETLFDMNEIMRSGFFATTGTSESFVQIVWKKRNGSAIQEVSSFSKPYSFGTLESLLRPLKVQVLTSEETTKLLFQIHHALYDGWSFDLLVSDFAKLLKNGAVKPRPKFRHVVEYYHHAKQGTEFVESKQYWAETLHGYYPIPLPNLNGRVVRSDRLASFRGKSIVHTGSLRACARELSVNPQVLYQAATAYICGLYLGISDVVIGTVTSGRTIPVAHIEDIMGPCISSLPFRLILSKFSTIRDMLLSTHRANRKMLEHCTIPLRDITKLCGLRPVERLFDVLFVWQESLVSKDEAAPLVKVLDSSDDLESKITVEFEPGKDEITFRLSYNPSQIPEDQIRYLSLQIDQLVDHFIHNIDGLVRDISGAFLSPTLSIANPSPIQTQSGQGPSQLVERWALQDPKREALVLASLSEGIMRPRERLTYGLLNARANQLAHVLVEKGVRQDQLVCVFMEKSIDLYVSILAVLKAGSGYLPIVPDTPIERTRRILADAEVNVCISESMSSTPLKRGHWTVLEVDKLDMSQYSDENLGVPYEQSHLAYATFTSGSTGRPKGVLVTQGNLMSNLEYLASIYPVPSGSRMLQSCSQAFDVSVFEIFFSWYVGISLYSAKKDDLFHNFEAAIDCLDITHLSLTPTVASLVDPARVPKVQFLVTAGEALTENVRRNWAGKGLFQGYGPSETTNICTVLPSMTTDHLINNIGPPFSNTSAFVLKPGSSTILPRGAVGELCFGGAQVFRGYLNRPELTAEKIIDHPSYGRVYRSGDMGVLLADNSILFTGRLDDQVKVRGQRVELGEINSIVLDNKAVRDAATQLIQYENMAQILVTFWVPANNGLKEFRVLPPQEFHSTTFDIFESLNSQLPSYMIPTHLIPITQIPMTHQAKIDKRLLQSTLQNLSRDYLETVTTGHHSESGSEIMTVMERTLVEVLTSTLSLTMKYIQRTTSFFSLGLDSVSAIRFARALRDAELGDVPVSTILRNPTVARLSSVISEHGDLRKTPKDCGCYLPDVFAKDETTRIFAQFQQLGMKVLQILPCTPLQEAMLSAPSASASSYFNMMTFNVIGSLPRLKECWEAMVQRHQIFRTAFIATNDPHYAFAQVVVGEEGVQWEQLENADDLTLHFQHIISNLLQAHKPPFRFGLQETRTTTTLVFSCHHALYDGIAISNLLEEVQKLYHGSTLPPPVPYERYLRYLLAQNLHAADEFWSNSLAGLEPTLFPTISSRHPTLGSRSRQCKIVLKSTLHQVLEFCQRQSISLLSFIQAAWAKLLSSCTGVKDVCFGNVISGRTTAEEAIERIVAPCFNTIPIRPQSDFEETNLELCQRLHVLNIDLMPFQLTPLRRIQAKVVKNMGRLFDTLVILQQSPTPLDSAVWTLEEDIGEMDVPLVCEISQNMEQETLKLVLHFQDSVLSTNDAMTLASVFDNMMQSLINFPDSPATDSVGFPSRTLAQSNLDFRILDPRGGMLLHNGFESNAVQKPDHHALEFRWSDNDTTTLTFKIMNQRANQVAHALIQRGVKPNDIVPIHMPKCPEFYTSILGILKAGGAFCPIHCDLPAARKRFMISEIRPKVIVCDQDALGWSGGIPVLNVHKVRQHLQNDPIIAGLRTTNLAYCLYTSGSTGTPKAVTVEHRAPVQTIESSRSLIPWSTDSRLLQYASVSFDMCYYDCFLAWTFGFALCAAEQDVMLDNLAQTINALDVNLLDLTPSVAASLRRADVPSVKWLYCIGEAMTPAVAHEWNGACLNSYGPTEAAFCTTIFQTGEATKCSIIGKPFPTTSFAVFAPGGDRPVPILGIGELFIGGSQLARGYHGNDKLTNEKFVQRCGQRFYKSGDMVRMLSDGNFEFLGRADDQVKIRGLRVELGEISNVIQACDERISAATTQVFKMEDNAKEQLVSFLVTGDPVDEAAISKLTAKARQAADSHLPRYMVPQFIMCLDKIPKSLAGKVDKRALEELFIESNKVESTSTNTAADGVVHKWTRNERKVLEILSKLAQVPAEAISPTTSIYQLGLDSISAVQIAADLRRRGLHANASDVMKNPNCRDLARHVGETSGSQPSQRILFDFASFDRKHRTEMIRSYCLNDADVETIRPCTPLQNGMLSQFIAHDGKIYFNYLRLQLDDGVNLERMKRAWDEVVRKHKLLRTGFAYVKDSSSPFVMICYSQDALIVPWMSTTAKEGAVEEWLIETRREMTKYLYRPPWRVRITEQDGVAYMDLALLHAIFDAQSLRYIFDDVTTAYWHQPLKPAQPLDPVIANILHLSSDEGDSQTGFWKKLGQGVTPLRFPDLSPLRCDPVPPSVSTMLASKTLGDLDVACRKASISLQCAAMASWAQLLSVYAGQPLVTFGVVLSGRTFDAAELAAFPCINTVPFVCEVTNDRKEILKRVMSLNAEIQRCQFTPLNNIQRTMGHPSQPLFDTLFTFQKLGSERTVHDLWTVVDERATVEYPLSIELEPKQGRLEYRLTFLPHLIPQEQAHLMLKQLDHFLHWFIFSSDGGSIDFSTARDLYSIVPAKEPTLPSEAELLHELVEATVRERPDSIALEFVTSLNSESYVSRKWTYAELDMEANKIANILITNGVKPGELVCTCFDKCPTAYFAMLGTLKAGCAFVAIDPGAPSARRMFIIKDSGARVLLSMEAHSMGIHTGQVEVVNLDQVNWQSQPASKPVLERKVQPHDRSYCLYTSGTTGTPKGCELTHDNAVQAMLAFRRLFEGHWDDKSRWLQFASFHFDVSVLEQYWSWSVGISVFSAPRDVIFEDLAGAIRVLDITHIDLTPSLARILHPDDVPSLCKGVFITGGESLKQEILDVWACKEVIYNGYGPTETTIGITMYPRVPANGKPSNIGPQFDNVGSYVLRPNSDIPVLRGGVGELCVSGKLVGKGYLNRDKLTQERFPHLSHFDERVYRTGDLVRILHDGTFDFLGRIDDQVKLRGQRLEVGEINTVIKQSGVPVSDVATLVLKHPKQQKEQLVSFVVFAPNTSRTTEIFTQDSGRLKRAREACQESLPPYMVPTHFVPISSLPLTTNNKVDARKLKDLFEALSTNDLQLLCPAHIMKDERWTVQEETIQRALKDCLNIEEDAISKDSSLFELGMDSISVISVSTALRQAGFAKASASIIMKNASVRRLARAFWTTGSSAHERASVVAAQQAITAAQHRHRRAVAEALFMDTLQIEALAPCTPLQQGMIARSLESDQGLYFNTFRFRLVVDVDTEKLHEALKATIRSTQILRTVFVNTDDGFMQAALRLPRLHFDVIELEDGLDEYLSKRREQWVQANRTNIQRPLEIMLIQSPKGDLLVAHMFHALYDGNSIGLIFKSLWHSYYGKQPVDGPGFQSALAYGPLKSVDGAKEFWRKHLMGVSFKPFPCLANDNPGSMGQTTATRTISHLQTLETVRRKLNVTTHAIAQACWMSVLYKVLKASVTLGIVVSGRSIDLEGADKIVGPLFNTIPYRCRAQRHENLTLASLIKRIHEFNVASHPYQHTSLRDIRKWCKRGPTQPLFDTLFVYQVVDSDEGWISNDLWELLEGVAEADYPLAVEVEQCGSDALKLTLVAQGHIVDEAKANGLLAEFEQFIRKVLKNPQAEHQLVSEHYGDDEVSIDVDPGPGSPSPHNGTSFIWTEQAIKIKQEVASLAGLDFGEVNEDTSIFQVGLDSIDAIRLSSKLSKRGITLSVSGIVRGLTIRNMLQHITKEKPKWFQGHSDMIFRSHQRRLEAFLRQRRPTGDVEAILPLTPLQEAMVAEMVASEYTRYFNHDVLKLVPGVDIEKLRKAWTEVVAKSPILRTSFVEIDDPSFDSSFAQVIHHSAHSFWETNNIDGEPDFSMIFTSIRKQATEHLTTQPPFYVRLIQAPTQAYLVLSIAHALYDGWSLGLLHSDVHQAYSHKLTSRPGYESALIEILSTSGPDATAFWRDYLTGANPSSFSLSPHVRRKQNPIVHRREKSSNTDLRHIVSFGKKNNVTLQTLGQTVYALVLAAYTQSFDVTFGSVLSGRDDDKKAKIMFPTMNTVAVRAILHGTRHDMLRYVQQNFANIKQWQHFPLRKALSLASAQGPLFDSLFICQKHPDHEIDKDRVIYKSIQAYSDVEYPVCVEMEIVGKQLIWRCAVKEYVFDDRGAQVLLDKLDLVLQNVMDHPDAATIDFTSGKASVCDLPPFESSDITAPVDKSKAKKTAVDRHQSRTARTIREVLSFVSKTPEEEITDDTTIFHIGLDSISAIKVSSLLRKRSIILSVSEMLKAGTIERMAQIVDGRASDLDDDVVDAQAVLQTALSKIDKVALLTDAGLDEESAQSIVPATAGQTYMISMWLNSNGAVFYPEFAYQIHGNVHRKALQKAWAMLISANDILRTCIVATREPSVPYVQVVLREPQSTFLDVTGWEEQQVLSAMRQRTALQPYVYLFVSKSSLGWDLKLKIHHALYDGVSLPLLLQQLQCLCNNTPTPAFPDATFSNLIAATSTAPAHAQRKSFWRKYFNNIMQRHLPQPLSPPRFKVEIFKPRLLPAVSKLDTLARSKGITPQSLFLAVYAKHYAALSCTPATQDVVVGIYLANRSLPVQDISSAAIPTVNLVPLRVATPLETDIVDAAAQIQYDIQEISSPANASVSLWEVKEWTGVKIDTFVNFLKLPDTEGQGEEVGEEGLRIVQAGRWKEDVCRVVEVADAEVGGAKELVDMRVNEAYLHALDVEATVRNGTLDVGLFVPEETLSLAEGERLVEDIRMDLEGLINHDGSLR